jgi:hypothetical protein
LELPEGLGLTPGPSPEGEGELDPNGESVRW